jgi:NADPH:quinone reductase-like Zn-dependent oxidoreductase
VKAGRSRSRRVTAAGVNFGDISQAYGTFLGGPQPPYPAGFEAAGEIVARGEAVTGLEPGARVIGAGIGCGAFAEYTVLPAIAVIPLPTGWAEQEALGLLVNWQQAEPTISSTPARPMSPQIYGELMGELFALIAAGVLGPGQPVTYELADGPKALTELETRSTVGKLALRP